MLDEPWDDDGDDLPRGPAHRKRKDRRPVQRTAPTLAREPRRVAVLALVGGLLVLAGFGSGAFRPPRGTSAVVPAAAALGGLPVVVAAAAKSSAWYCPGPIPLGPGAGSASIALTGTAGRPVRGSVTVVKSDGSSSTVQVVVPARGTTTVPVGGGVAGGGSGWAAASVELDGGGVGADQVVVAPNGPTSVPCQVTTSSTWYFPAGSTAPGADVHVSLYNPTAAPAIASLAFSVSSQFTTTGSGVGRSTVGGAPVTTPVQPPPLQGISVPPGQLVVVDVGRQVQLQPEIAASVTTTAGRLVAGEWSTVILGGTHEASLAQGVAQGQRTWWFPVSEVKAPGVDAMAFWLFNPTAVAASAQLLLPVGGSQTSSISVIVPAASLVVVSPPAPASPTGRRGKSTSVPPAWVEVESSPGIVVARDGLSEQSRSRGSRHSTRLPPGVVGTGLPGAVIGSASPAHSCLLLGTGASTAPGTPAPAGGTLAVTAPSSWSGTVSVQVELLVGGPDSPNAVVLGTVTVDPGTVHMIDLPKEVPASLSLLLVGGPVVAERDYGVGGSAGSLDSIGIPVD